MGLLQISVKYKEVRGPNPSISSHHSAPKDKNRKEKRKKKKEILSTQYQSCQSPPSFEPLLTNATAVMEVLRRSASSHGDSDIISHMSNHAS